MIYTELTNKAMKIAYEAHAGQKDKGGIPYIFHPYHLAEQMDNEIRTCIALLHDVVEDTDITFEELEKEFPKEIIIPLTLLTHEDSIEYDEYINGICTNLDAALVKLADILHNMKNDRLAGIDVREEDKMRWARKYRKAHDMVLEFIVTQTQNNSQYETEWKLMKKLINVTDEMILKKQVYFSVDREIRNLQKELEKSYPTETQKGLASTWYDNGICELSEEIKKIIAYLQESCENFALDNYSFLTLLRNDTYESIVNRHKKYVSYLGSEKISLSTLSFTEEKWEQYYTLMEEYAFTEEQIKEIMTIVLRLGVIAKQVTDIKESIDAFSVFDITIEERNRFICENADFMFSVYSRNLPEKMHSLIRKYGKTDGYTKLTLYPQIIHSKLGVDEIRETEGRDRRLKPMINEILNAIKSGHLTDINVLLNKLSPEECALMNYILGVEDGKVKFSAIEVGKEFHLTSTRVVQIVRKICYHKLGSSGHCKRSRKLKDYLESE